MVGPCIVAFCKNTGSHRFPLDEERRRKWIEAIRHLKPGLSVKKYSLICSAHFRPTDFAKTLSSYRMPELAPKILKKTAVPSIFSWKRTGDDIEEQLLMLSSTSRNKNVEQISTAAWSKHVNAASVEEPHTSSSFNIKINDTFTKMAIMSPSKSESAVTRFDPKNALKAYCRVPRIVFVEEQIFNQVNEDIAHQDPLRSSDGNSIVKTEASSMSKCYDEDHVNIAL